MGAFTVTHSFGTVIESNDTSISTALCPDLLHYGNIGVADNLRGRVVRAFFWLMQAWPTRGR